MDPITSFTVETIEVLLGLIKAGNYTQALIILYSAIDTMAWTNIPEGNVFKPIFCAWVDEYMNSDETIGCKSIDLYSARCGLVHSYSSESSLSQEGEAREIWYVSSPASKDDLQIYADQLKPNTIAVNITELISAFIIGTENYKNVISNDPEKKKSVNKRLEKWFRFIPSNSIRDVTLDSTDP
jgi:uncharacterized protein YqiB (DUF1249 family)